MSEIKYINLHGHSCAGSPFDAVGFPDEHIKVAVEKGMSALALTDHGNMNGLPYQIGEAKALAKNGVSFKTIFGCEVYYHPSIASWQKEYEKAKEEKQKLRDNESEPEDEQAARRAIRNKLNQRCHLVLLAKNAIGLKNLFTLVSQSHEAPYFYRYPRIDYNLLKKHSEGLVVLTACLGGFYGNIYWNNINQGADKVVDEMRKATTSLLKIVNIQDFYGELQWNKVPEQHELNQFIIQMSYEFGFDLVSTCDSHYPRLKNWKDREVYKRLGWLGKIGKDRPGFMSSEIPEKVEDLDWELFVKNGDEMWDAYKKYSKSAQVEYDDDLIRRSIETTHNIAFEKIEDFTIDSSVKLPNFVLVPEQHENFTLSKMAAQGLKKMKLHTRPDYVARLKKELNVIQSRGFSKYFLVMKAIVDKGKEITMMGPGRGSAAGALTSYVLGITQVDPIKWDLQFERFLREDATDYPDIDTDWGDPVLLKETLAAEWGEHAVVLISNFNTLQLKSLIKDISKMYNVPFQEANNVTKQMFVEATPAAKKEQGITAGVYVPTFEETMRLSPTLQKFLHKYPQIASHIEVLHGGIRSTSQHAGGVLVGEDLQERMPLINCGKKIQTPWTEGQHVRHLEPLGFIKFDLLGLASLRMIEGTIRLILQRHYGVQEPTLEDVKAYYAKHLHPDVIDFGNQKIWEEIYHKGRFVGIFQMTEKGAQGFCQRAKPRSLEELSNITATWRPGPMEAGVADDYVDAKNDPSAIVYDHPEIEKILGPTSSFMIYQEQIADLAHKLGDNISLNEGNVLRKLLVKKGIGEQEEKKEKIWQRFESGCLKKGISRAKSKELFRKMEEFSKYGFNKCLSLDTLVETFYRIKQIKDVRVGEYVKSEKGFVKVKQVYNTGKKRVVRFKTKHGKELVCSLDHKIQTPDGMKTLREILEKKHKILTEV